MKGKDVNKKLLHFIAEAGMLKRTPRSGWSVVGVEHAESVADHSFRCAVIGYCLAHQEGASVYQVLLMTLFNDIHEARIGDLHKMAVLYLDLPAGEDKSFAGQVSGLPGGMKKELQQVRKQYTGQETPEAIIARDADILECLIQAKEYYEQGFSQAAKFLKKAPDFLRSKSARKLWKKAQKVKLNDWWSGLTSFKR